MIGRVEVTEILGMVGTCALLLFAGFSVETLEGNVDPARAVSVETQDPEVPAALGLPDEIRLEAPDLERPLRAAPPELPFDLLLKPTTRSYTCGCRYVIT